MTIACPLCTNPNEILSQPSSSSWQQASCSSCEANLVLVREPSSSPLRRSLKSAVRLKPASAGTRQSAVIVRSRLFTVVTTVLALGVLVYLYFGTGLFSNNQIPTESGAHPTTTLPSTSPRQSQAVSQPHPSTANWPVTKEGVEVVLSLIDHAVQKKDADAILRYIASNATFTIHMQRGANRQSTSMNRDDYRKALQMGFAFPGTYEYRRVGTVIEAAPDGRSAKATFQSVETHRQGGHEARIEGEEVATFRAQGLEPVIVAIEQTVHGAPN